MTDDIANGGGLTEQPAEGADDLPPRQEGSPRATPDKDETGSSLDRAGVSGGTAGTGGDNKAQDELDR